MQKNISFVLILALLAPLASHAAHGQDMPAPRRSPRTPVSRQVLGEPRDVMPSSHVVQGPAAIIDGEKLRIGDTDLRLFGIVPPQLAASFGPQARSALDALANGQAVTCQVRDRDRDGRLLATCRNGSGNDMAMELLKRGLAVTARGTIAGTELAASYMSAEQGAQNAKIGLWSVTSPAAAAPAAVIVPIPVVKPEPTPVAVEEPKKEEKIAPHVADKTVADAQIQAKIAADVTQQQQAAQARLDDTAYVSPETNAGFFERYQILIACFLMLATALSLITAIWAQKSREKIDELKAIAAALRGELMAARSICLGRAKSITNDEEDTASTWPRIRASLYQAYVGKLGILGSDLARQIASIYGQSSDYAALYSPTGNSTQAPKKQALENLARYIDNVVPTLAVIEKVGKIPATPATMAPQQPTYRNQPRATPLVPPAPHAAPRATLPQEETPAAQAEVTPPHLEPEPAEAQEPSSTMRNASRSPVALWENVRGFLQQSRNAVAEMHPVADEHSEYAAMIEADMARYQYGETLDSLDISPKKKSG